MAASDLIGALAGLLLVIAPLKDQRARWKVRRNASTAAEAPDNRKPLRTLVAEAWEAHRNAYDPLDAWTQLAGALGILLAFGIKLLGG